MAGIADKIYKLIKPAVEKEGVTLWDVRFIKEGASHYLRVFIDKPEGVTINDCTNVSHAIDPIIDEADPIDVSYYLEVCSPGIEREIISDEHFSAVIGKRIRLRLYKAVDSKKEFIGNLVSYQNNVVTIETDGNNIEFNRKDIAKANLEE